MIDESFGCFGSSICHSRNNARCNQCPVLDACVEEIKNYYLGSTGNTTSFEQAFIREIINYCDCDDKTKEFAHEIYRQSHWQLKDLSQAIHHGKPIPLLKTTPPSDIHIAVAILAKPKCFDKEPFVALLAKNLCKYYPERDDEMITSDALSIYDAFVLLGILK